jgi:LysM repeat protein
MRADMKWRTGLRLSLGFLLLVALSVAGVALRPGVSHAAPAQDDTIVYVVKPGDTLRSIAAANDTSIAAIVRANGLANPDYIYPGQKLVLPVQGGMTGNSGTNLGTSTPSGSTDNTPTPTSTPVSSDASSGGTSSRGVYHTVRLGDTLASIGRTYGVGASAIAEANGVSDPDLIWVGQKLLIPGPAQPGSSSSTPTPQPQPAGQPGASAGAATPELTQQPASSGAVDTPAPQPTQQPQATRQPAVSKPTVYVVQAGDTLSKIASRLGTTVAALIAVNDLPNSDVLSIGQQLIIPRPGVPSVTKASLRPSKFVVSISKQRCWLYQGATVIAKWVCSTGRPGTGTRPGTYKIQSKLPKAYGSTWNIWMPYWLGIYYAGASENGIHGLPWNAKSGAQIWTGYVGTPITFGCVMLDNVNAKMLYDLAYIGMPVIVQP